MSKFKELDRLEVEQLRKSDSFRLEVQRILEEWRNGIVKLNR